MAELCLAHSQLHSAVHQANLLQQALESGKTPLGCFLGAGCPLGIYDEEDKESIVHIPDVAGLTTKIRERLEATPPDEEAETNHASLWDTLVEECKGDTCSVPNVEDVLAELRTLHGRRGKGDFNGISKKQLAALDTAICGAVIEEVNKDLPAHRCSYKRFASWARGIQRLTPLEIFTPNYDLLIEESFEELGIPLFDGFIGSKKPFFDIASIEQDAIPPRWSRLWKLHGSINWEKRDDGAVFRVSGVAKSDRAMIYPSHLKFDQSRRMPYLAMLDRLKAFLRPANPMKPTPPKEQRLGPPVLIICGYSFSDDHINEIILDGLKGNPSAQCFVLEFRSLAECNRVITHAQEQHNLTVLARDGAVVGKRAGRFRSDSSIGAEHSPWLRMIETPANGETPPKKHVECHLGDFHHFGLFVEQIRGVTQDDPTSTTDD